MELSFKNVIESIQDKYYLKNVPFNYNIDMVLPPKNVEFQDSQPFEVDSNHVKYCKYGRARDQNYHKISLFFSEGGYETFLNDLIELAKKNNWELTIDEGEKNLNIELVEDNLLKIYSKKQLQDWQVDFAQPIHVDKTEEKNTSEEE